MDFDCRTLCRRIWRNRRFPWSTQRQRSVGGKNDILILKYFMFFYLFITRTYSNHRSVFVERQRKLAIFHFIIVLNGNTILTGNVRVTFELSRHTKLNYLSTTLIDFLLFLRFILLFYLIRIKKTLDRYDLTSVSLFLFEVKGRYKTNKNSWSRQILQHQRWNK